MSNFDFLGPLPQDLINKLHANKVPEYKIRNALSEQENKRIRLAQRQIQRIAELEKQQELQEKKRKRQLLLRQQEERRQQALKQQKLQQYHKPQSNYSKEDDGPEL